MLPFYENVFHRMAIFESESRVETVPVPLFFEFLADGKDGAFYFAGSGPSTRRP